MKKCILTLSVFFVAIGISIPAYAYDFKIGDFCYNIIEGNSVEVTSGVKYSGIIVIPEQVIYNGKTYNVTSIGKYAFQFCNDITSITIPNSITSIAEYAFWGSDLKSIYIPSSVTTIGVSVFYQCYYLSSITVDKSNSVYDSRNNCNAIIESSKNTLIAGCKNTIIPNGVISIGNGAFAGCRDLKSITIPKSVKNIASASFSKCINLESIIVEEGNTALDSRDHCNAVIATTSNTLIVGCKNTKIPNDVKIIGVWSFEGISSLTSIEIPESVTTIQWGAFIGCGMTSLVIPNSVTYIGGGAFDGCKLTSVVIPNSVTYLGEAAFQSCKDLTSVTISSGLANIERSVFNGCSSLTSISIPNSVTSIGSSAFYSCSGLTSISIPNSVTSIGDYAFSRCSGLTSISIPNSVTSIGSSAFSNCSGLKDVISEIKTPFEISENVFSVYSTAKLTVPIGTKSAYQSTNYWNKFSNIVESTSESNDDFGKVANVVDLGLSVKWASWNIGASKMGDYGGLYGAGDPTGKKTSTNVSDYYFNDGGSICGTEYDLAHVKWGDLWRMPKWSELEELKSKCTWTNGEVDGVKGSWVKGPNGNSIFLPWAGNRKGTSTFSGKGSYGYYWSGDMGVSLHSYGYKDLDIGSGGVNQTDGAENYWGQSIRPVYGDSNNGSNTSTKRTIHVATAGTLPNLISESEKYTIEELTLTGELNGTDFRLLRDMAGNNYLGQKTSGKLKVLDLTNAKVITGGKKYLDTDRIIGNGIDASGSYHYDISKSNVIPDYVFFGCYLKEIRIPNSVTSIGREAFSYCRGLTSITIPNSVTSIGGDAFYGCSGLTSISIPNSVTSIGSYAFSNCRGLTFISIPNSVTSIGDYAFSRCSGLTSIKVESGNTVYDSRNNCNAIIKKSNNELIVGCRNTVIPNSVTSIGNYAFYYCSGLTSISIPNSVTSIGNYAFSGCSGLTSISIPNSVTSIGNSAFSDCSGLKDVISEIKTPFEISENVFSVYSTAKLTVPSGTKSAYQSTAGWNKFTNIVESTNSGDNTGTKRTIHVATAGTLPNLILESEKYTIEELTLTGELNGTDFRLLRDMAGCNYLGEKTSGKLAVLDMTNAKIVAGGEKYLDTDKIYGKGGVNSSGSFHYGINNSDAIPDYVFCGCYLKEMHIPNSVTSIGNQAFSLWSGPTSITIPNSVKSIGNYAFYSCVGLTSITIPNSVMSIGSGAFRYCSGLKDVISEIKTPFEISENVFSVYSTAKLTVPKGTKSAYLSTSSWNKFSTIIEAEGGNVETEVTFASNGITYKGTIATQLGEVIAVGSNSKNLEIPSTVSYDGKSYSVTSIKNGALDGLTLNYLSIPSSVTSLDNTIFSNCDLGALIWKANNALSSNVFSNAKFSTASNFLLYVNSASYAPSNVKNVVVGTSANTILLSDNGGNFYCPKEFTAQYISYSHNYSMKTGGNGKGWETLALPFDVQKIEHKTKGTLTPFAKYNSADDSQRPFWLYEFGSNGFKRTDAIKANTPYIIAMPNDSKYDEEYIITGDVTFSATNAQVYETESLVKPSSNGKTFAPAFAAVNSSSSVYALNVSNDLTYYSGPYDAGSRFVSNLRNIYPFEAYMTTSSSGARALAIEFEDDATGIEDIPIMYRSEGRVKVYNLTGLLMFSVPQSDFAEKWKYLPSGVYIVNGQKMIKSDDVQYNLVY